MKRKQLREAIYELVPSFAFNERNRTSAINLLPLNLFGSERQVPGHRSPFGRGEILHRMKRKRAEIGNLTGHLAMA